MKQSLLTTIEPADTTNPAPQSTKSHQEWDAIEAGPIGRDPRTMTPAELTALGFERQPLLRAVREKCIDCCAGSPGEVRRCAMRDCSLWPYRMGTNPWAGTRSLAQRGASLTNLAHAAQIAPSLGEKNPVTPFPGVQGAGKASAGNSPPQADNPATVTRLRRR